MVYALMIIYRKFFPAISLFLLACAPAWSIQSTQYEQLDGLFKQVINKSSYTEDDLKKLFEQVEIQPRIIEIMDRPAESMPWHRYRKIFLNEKNISSGAKFWKAHADILARAEDKFGVPPEIIVATLGVETRLWRQVSRRAGQLYRKEHDREPPPLTPAADGGRS